MILLVEDNADIAQGIVQFFSEQGLEIHLCTSGEDALFESKKAYYQLILLDLMLPERNGFEILKDLRKVSEIPVFIISAKSQTSDLIKGFELGADDYIVKPFSIEVLFARVKRKLQDSKSKAIHLGDCEFFPEAMLLRREGEDHVLSKKEALLLKLLLSRPGQTYTREVIITSLWEDADNASERSVDNLIVSLRKKIGKDIIHSIRGVGYKLHL